MGLVECVMNEAGGAREVAVELINWISAAERRWRKVTLRIGYVVYSIPFLYPERHLRTATIASPAPRSCMREVPASRRQHAYPGSIRLKAMWLASVGNLAHEHDDLAETFECGVRKQDGGSISACLACRWC